MKNIVVVINTKFDIRLIFDEFFVFEYVVHGLQVKEKLEKEDPDGVSPNICPKYCLRPSLFKHGVSKYSDRVDQTDDSRIKEHAQNH